MKFDKQLRKRTELYEITRLLSKTASEIPVSGAKFSLGSYVRVDQFGSNKIGVIVKRYKQNFFGIHSWGYDIKMVDGVVEYYIESLLKPSRKPSTWYTESI